MKSEPRANPRDKPEDKFSLIPANAMFWLTALPGDPSPVGFQIALANIAFPRVSA